jgi:outer membrane protein OmpA-like peptidoglycan-associated protein
MRRARKRIALLVLTGVILPATLSGARADIIRLYREGIVPDPAIVAQILGQRKHLDRGLTVAEESPPSDLGETVTEDDIRRRAASAVAEWREKVSAAQEVPNPTTSARPSSGHNDPSPDSSPHALTPKLDERPTALALVANFTNNSAKIVEKARAPLDAVAQGLKLAGFKQTIVVEGHANATGSAAHNRHLSKLRAEAVKRYLVEEHGIPAEILITVGYGSEVPLKGMDPAAAQNRRVQFTTTQT